MKKWNYETVKNYFHEYGYILLEEDYKGYHQKLKVQCPIEHVYEVNFSNFKDKGSRCPYCSGHIVTYEIVKEYIESQGYKLLSTEYINNREHLEVECGKGHKNKVTWHNFQRGKRCPQCYLERNRGENKPNWKGGASHLHKILRDKINDWKKDSMQHCNFKCVLTGDRFDVIHHLHGFNEILDETILELDLQDDKLVINYTEEEIQLICDKFLELHDQYPLGVCLKNELHELFHVHYGCGNNTIEQFIEYKARLKSGEFNSFLEENNLSLII